MSCEHVWHVCRSSLGLENFSPARPPGVVVAWGDRELGARPNLLTSVGPKRDCVFLMLGDCTSLEKDGSSHVLLVVQVEPGFSWE